MRELFGIVTLLAVALGILALFPRRYAAGLAGLAVLATLLAILVIQPTRPGVMIAWWALFLVYLLWAVLAAFLSLAGP